MRRQLSGVHDGPKAWRVVLAYLASSSIALATETARAQAMPVAACAAGARGWISVHTPAPANDEQQAWQDVVQHVRSELSLRRVGLCSSAGSGQALADLAFEGDAARSVTIKLSAGEPLRLLAERSLELTAVPADARMLSIAVASDELLAANWAELEQPRAESAARPPPEPAAPPEPKPAPPRFELGPGFVYEHFAGGQALLGAELRGGVHLAERFTLSLRLGWRQGLPDQAEHGSLHSSALLAGLGTRLGVAHSSRFRLGLIGRADALRLSVSAYPEPGASAHTGRGVAVVLSAGPELALALSPRIRVGLELTAGGAVRPVHVTDTGARVSGAAGLAVAVGGGVLVDL